MAVLLEAHLQWRLKILLMIRLLPLLLFFATTNLVAQTSQRGGFIHQWENYTDDDFTGLGVRAVAFDSTDMAPIVHAPDEGIHPRVYFGPSEIPDIRYRLDSTATGQSITASIRAYTTLLHLGDAYSQNAAYALDPEGRRYIDNKGAWNGAPYYAALKAEDPAVWTGVAIKQKHRTATLMALEAFTLLLFPELIDPAVGLSVAQRRTDLARAMHFWAGLVLGDPTVNPNSNNYNHFGGVHMALCYDLLYNELNPGQRDTIRQALAQIIPAQPRHGSELAAYANTSNWSTLNGFEILTNLAIEGEPGYRPELTRLWMRSLHNYINYGWYPSGAGYEGLGKNAQFVTTLIVAAKRGYGLLSHPHVRAYGEQFLPAILQPFGQSFTSYDVWGGSGRDPVRGGFKINAADAVGLKYIFPNSPQVDFVWRNYIEGYHQGQAVGPRYAFVNPEDSYSNFLLPAAVFCRDYDADTPWEAQAAAVVDDYIAEDRGLAVLRSGPARDALAVQFHARQDMGGHTHGDRLDFTLSGLERIWIRKSYGGSQFQPSKFHSMVLINDLGVPVGDPDGDKCRQPATLLDYNFNPKLSTVAADATYPYRWEWHWSPQTAANDHPWLGNNGWEKVTETWNDFRFQPGAEPHFDLPFYDYAHWHQGGGRLERLVKREYNAVQQVSRRVGLLKGPQPMLLVTDDVVKDGAVHHYKWLGQLARDLEVDHYDVQLADADYRCDIILREPAATGDRRLLVRVLDNANYDGSTPPGYLDTLTYEDYFTGNPYNPNPNFVRQRLVIESQSVSPNYKVLLFPYRAGDLLPRTDWNPKRDTLRVTFDNLEECLLHFYQDASGVTHFDVVETATAATSVPDKTELSVFPNPAACHLTVRAATPIKALTLVDAAGRTVYERTELNMVTHLVPTAALPTGIYQVRLRTKEELFVESVSVVGCE